MKTLGIVRGKFLNQYEMQSFVPLVGKYDITAFSSLTPYHDTFPFPVIKLPSPMDVPEFPYKMPILNRMFIDAHYLFGLEERLRGFDIVHTAETYYHYTHQCLAVKKKGYVKKVVATVLENIPFNNEGIWGRKALKRQAREDLDHIIALTEKTKNALLIEGADEKKITVISHGIDTKRFIPSSTHWKTLGEDHLLMVLFSGRLEAYKGVWDIFEAAKICFADGIFRKKIRFVFAGNGSEKKALLAKTKQLGMDGYITYKEASYAAMPDLYQKADIFIAPSVRMKTWEEQYCTALLEAQSMGLPIITTRSGGIPENVGNTALFVEEHDAKQIVAAIKKFVDSPKIRVEYGKRARIRAEKVHDVSHIAKKLDLVYQHLLPGKSFYK